MPNLQLTDREKVTILDNIRGSVDRYIEQYKESYPSEATIFEQDDHRYQVALIKKACAKEIEKIKDIMIQHESLQPCLETWPGLWEFIPGYIKEEYEARRHCPGVWGRKYPKKPWKKAHWKKVYDCSKGIPAGFLTLDMIIVVLKLKGE
jgi:hypothetical protein